jgi:hypothetical protein
MPKGLGPALVTVNDPERDQGNLRDRARPNGMRGRGSVRGHGYAPRAQGAVEGRFPIPLPGYAAARHARDEAPRQAVADIRRRSADGGIPAGEGRQ